MKRIFVLILIFIPVFCWAAVPETIIRHEGPTANQTELLTSGAENMKNFSSELSAADNAFLSSGL
ncbi:hypothetical protein K7I13_05000 [Brucepastera parasyntrophica]|uniref:hypothetical protein n=1 Tax=Brucepastera parasyntrophica TaxID=2880008 RepID=UPI00210A97E5|nr:hypothetical protein [Brucepastera parasyntrophica]ULQ60636.1 hypothetical protein K7I13_05000 [Brucepastera parasyntrophica]